MAHAGFSTSDLFVLLSKIPPYVSATVQHITIVLGHAQRLITPTINSLATSEPDIISILILLVIAWLSLLVLNQVVRVAYGVVAMAIKVALLTVAGIAVVYVLNRGPEDAGHDLGYAVRTLIEYVKSL
ncbi:hypothetical protein V1514DRAFT_331442 [Lipomyces japonicus]|uniref:uncharacterized protein n=1 Tax=Lipomyces japonicus TaxID=56871 RepID=UPI0034CE4C1B